jgi:isoleucyl-tRNA synthetase
MTSDEQPKNKPQEENRSPLNKQQWNEEEVLAFWRENKIFEKSVEREAKPPAGSGAGDFVFYDGPPFATGLPHYGHILASVLKDAIPRYRTMRGYRVPRRWGWDCHGLPIENLIEKDLGLKTKKDIESYGVAKFNRAAKESVLKYEKEWKEIIPRIGRWVDMESSYKTMDASYTESVWWMFKTLYDKGLIYEGYKPMHICPRCETTLANFEVAQGYKDITDLSVTVKFRLEAGQKTHDFTTDDNTYILAWTTTPWTLPGNVALAVNDEIVYTKIKKSKIKNQNDNAKLKNDEHYIIAKERIDNVLGGESYDIEAEFKGSDLIGKKYEPLFDYYSKDEQLKNREKGWKIYGADFVTTEDGTGVVHIAPAFGEDDMNLGQKESLPFVQHVGMDGHFKPEVKDFADMFVKPKSDDEKERLSTDIAIIKYLQEHGYFFSKEKVTHSYPHCWRCDTPLLNYAASSWFVEVTKIKEGKDGLLDNNQKIKWVPEHLRDGRFGKWLAGARDWAISRSRFWGAPLPVWKCDQCKEVWVLGSVADIQKHTKPSGNKYFAMRHGQSENNVKNLINCHIASNHYGLTDLGRSQVKKSAEKLQGEKIDLIFSSDFLRTRETAELSAEILGLDKAAIVYDERLREVNVGIFDGEDTKKYHDYFQSRLEKFTKTPPEGEDLTALKNRITQFIYEADKKYANKNILIVSHEYPIWMLFAGSRGADAEEAVAMREDRPDFIKNGEIMDLPFAPLPHDENYILDLHRPYIDEVKFACQCGGEMRRVPEVFDCWVESGSMPFASVHYPFENREQFEKSFPAEFIAEGVDQTRGWFYNLLVLSTALFNKPAFKNVIVNGIILAEDGQKMSKKLKNYPDPMEVVNKYGADALRLYLFLSPAVRADNLLFSEKGVSEMQKKVIMRLLNVVSFYEMYGVDLRPTTDDRRRNTGNILDQWIIARLNQATAEVTAGLEGYEIDRAARPIVDFIDDLSTWYLRRSRERFKDGASVEDAEAAASTLCFVLLEMAKIMAPFTPFIAERIWQTLGGAHESVHLVQWPEDNKLSAEDEKIVTWMAKVRRVASAGLELRAKFGMKVRQPLQAIRIKNDELGIKESAELLQILKDELNIKEVVFDAKIVDDLELDTNITPELREEGVMRDLIRATQDLRKKAGLLPGDKMSLSIESSATFQEIVQKNLSEFQKQVSANTVEFGNVGENTQKSEIKIAEEDIMIAIK